MKPVEEVGRFVRQRAHQSRGHVQQVAVALRTVSESARESGALLDEDDPNRLRGGQTSQMDGDHRPAETAADDRDDRILTVTVQGRHGNPPGVLELIG